MPPATAWKKKAKVVVEPYGRTAPREIGRGQARKLDEYNALPTTDPLTPSGQSPARSYEVLGQHLTMTNAMPMYYALHRGGHRITFQEIQWTLTGHPRRRTGSWWFVAAVMKKTAAQGCVHLGALAVRNSRIFLLEQSLEPTMEIAETGLRKNPSKATP